LDVCAVLLSAQRHGRLAAERPARRHVGSNCRCRGEDGLGHGEHERIDCIDLVEHFRLTLHLDQSNGEYRSRDQACVGQSGFGSFSASGVKVLP
jgi:hypothetical protein